MDLVLFDIDGTLVDTGGAGRRAIEEAARLLYRRPDIFDDVAFDGATDRAICRAALRKLERPFDEVEIDRLLDAYVSLLGPEVDRSQRYQIHPGAEQLAQAMVEAGVLLGLGTGNVEAGARVKLQRGDLNRFFTFGGFGDDAEDRAALLRAGLRRGEAILGRRAREVWVIGDTPKDYAAGHAIGAKVLLVATGRYTRFELAQHEPELCVESLEDPRVLALLERRLDD
ncbi:MAG: HAD hydrolase-like protein [Deltaproteobacteria bacterium]|nr:HAD hydrolase-like protein [Deltaproteobacteria bacterium]